MLVSIAWTGGTTGLVFWVLDQYNMLRVEMEHEFKVSHHVHPLIIKLNRMLGDGSAEARRVCLPR